MFTKLKKNCGDRKPQDSQALLNSQENVLQTISSVFTQSSQSTNVGDMEETLLQAMETGNFRRPNESTEPTSYSLRKRNVGKQSDELQQTPKTSRSVVSDKVNQLATAGCEDVEENSQESVSMLQDCYDNRSQFPELMETCFNSELQEIDIYNDEEMDNPDERVSNESTGSCRIEKVESSTQTDYSSSWGDSSQEKEMMKHAKFISSIVRLKATLSSRKTVSDKNLRDIIEGEEYRMEIDSEANCQSVPKETIDYLLRSSDVENVFCETARVLLDHLDKTLAEDFGRVACSWKNSVYEMTVEMLIQAVDIEDAVAKMVDRFLCRTIQSVLNNEDKSKNLTLESKANLIISFCQSTHLSCSAINFIIEKLKAINLIARHDGRTSLSEKISWMYLTKNSYYLLQILESSLDILKGKIDGGKIKNSVKKPESKYYNVLEMWKKHWNRDEASEEQKSGHEWEEMVSDWCRELDEILLHCVYHVPVLSMAVERCVESAKEIFRTCHPNVERKACGKLT